MANLSKTTQDHEEIRRWAEERGGKPSHVRSTGSGGDVGILRIDFPGYSGEGTLEPISWEEWFVKFDEGNLALLYEEETAGGARSNFNKIVSAQTAAENEERGRSHAKKAASKKSSANKASSKTTKRATSRRGGAKKAAKSAGKAAHRATAKKSRKTVSKKRSSGAKKSASRGSARKKSTAKKSLTKKRR